LCCKFKNVGVITYGPRIPRETHPLTRRFSYHLRDWQNRRISPCWVHLQSLSIQSVSGTAGDGDLLSTDFIGRCRVAVGVNQAQHVPLAVPSCRDSGDDSRAKDGEAHAIERTPFSFSRRRAQVADTRTRPLPVAPPIRTKTSRAIPWATTKTNESLEGRKAPQRPDSTTRGGALSSHSRRGNRFAVREMNETEELPGGS
jgi:hypothetical protein